MIKDPQIVVDMDKAVLERLHPAVTRWNRLEGRPRTHHFDRALQAEVRDALWMLSRQWQMGEFEGDDAGSPVLARAVVDLLAIDRYQADHAAVEPMGLAEPLEARVERRPLPLRAGDQYLSLDLRLAVGRRWLKLLERERAAGRMADNYHTDFMGQYAVAVPDPESAADAAICAHAEAWQQAGAAAERALDGVALLEHIAGGGNAFDGTGAPAGEQPLLTALAEKLDAWLRDLLYQPPAGTDAAGDAWLPERLEYQFGLSAQIGAVPGAPAPDGPARELVMRAEEYYHGHLDWYALERSPREERLGEPGQPQVEQKRVVHTFLPAPVTFEGMPSTRWWAFEDRRTNFGDVRPDSVDLGKLLLMEFALVYANDWFVLPYTLPVGSVAEVRGIAISNVFGERFWIEPLRESPAQTSSRWSLFSLSTTAGAPERSAPPARLVLLPTTTKIQESAAVEEVALIRDELANMVWGIENRILLPSGGTRQGAEAAREYLQYLQRIDGPPPIPPDPVAPIRYQVMNNVPEQWIPFIPVHVENSVREIQLQRAALPRVMPNAGTVEKVRPRTTLLRHNLPAKYMIHEEEVPRAGAVVKQTYQRTRWIGGKVFTWFGARKSTGRGEGSSGLRFDLLVNAQKGEPPDEG